MRQNQTLTLDMKSGERSVDQVKERRWVCEEGVSRAEFQGGHQDWAQK